MAQPGSVDRWWRSQCSYSCALGEEKKKERKGKRKEKENNWLDQKGVMKKKGSGWMIVSDAIMSLRFEGKAGLVVVLV